MRSFIHGQIEAVCRHAVVQVGPIFVLVVVGCVSECLPALLVVFIGGGRLGVPGDGVLTWEESKAHLALYAVTSSPLILGNGEQNARPAQLTDTRARSADTRPRSTDT